MQDVYTYYFFPNAIIVIGPTHFNSGFFCNSSPSLNFVFPPTVWQKK